MKSRKHSLRVSRWAIRIVSSTRMNPLRVRNAAIALLLIYTDLKPAEVCKLRCGDPIQGHVKFAVDYWKRLKQKILHESVDADAPLFCGRPGQCISYRGLRNIWDQILVAAGARKKGTS